MEQENDLPAIVRNLMTPGKGIFAADESPKTMEKRLALVKVAETPENGVRLREVFFGTDGIECFLTGVILYEGTLHEQASDGAPLADLLTKRGIMIGVKADTGLGPLFPHHTPEGEQVSRGLDTLPERLTRYKSAGATFLKWRSAFLISEHAPSYASVWANAHVLAQYASNAHAMGLVPIVEPEVLLDGAHSMNLSKNAHLRVLEALFETLAGYGVDPRGVILKTSMVLAGKESGVSHSPEEVAEATLSVLERTVPRDLGGVVFLSGGQTPHEATERLEAISRAATGPWPISFSYSRAIEEEAILAWKGDDANTPLARSAFNARLSALCNAIAV